MLQGTQPGSMRSRTQSAHGTALTAHLPPVDIHLLNPTLSQSSTCSIQHMINPNLLTLTGCAKHCRSLQGTQPGSMRSRTQSGHGAALTAQRSGLKGPRPPALALGATAESAAHDVRSNNNSRRLPDGFDDTRSLVSSSGAAADERRYVRAP